MRMNIAWRKPHLPSVRISLQQLIRYLQCSDIITRICGQWSFIFYNTDIQELQELYKYGRTSIKLLAESQLKILVVHEFGIKTWKLMVMWYKATLSTLAKKRDSLARAKTSYELLPRPAHCFINARLSWILLLLNRKLLDIWDVMSAITITTNKVIKSVLSPVTVDALQVFDMKLTITTYNCSYSKGWNFNPAQNST